ncbi:MAG: alpha/beta hydrolase [Erythrobacter sp.]|nr:alpha/beta hydrolase [Erythrobacter sp.]NCQ63997.1 alpha/beta hydrolase [Alphaproteobacteria bacterium]
MEKKPKEPGGCCLFQMLLVLGLTILAYNVYHWVWPDLRHKLLDTVDLPFTFSREIEERGPLSYGKDPEQDLYIYRSEDAPEDVAQPVLMFIHGGSWSNGDPSSYGFIGRNFAPKGFVVVNVGYRLLPEGRYPAMLIDSAAALKWTRQNIAKYGGDPDQIYLMGHSAGAYNAVMLALDRRWTRRAGLPDDTIKGVIGLAGPYDFLPFDNDAEKEAFGKVSPPAASQPVSFARRSAPPMLLATGYNDETVDRDNAEAMYDALVAKGAPARHAIFNDMGHMGILMTLAQPFGNDRWGDTRVKDQVLAFLRKQVKQAARERARAERAAREAAATRDANSDPAAAEAMQASGDIQPAGG